MNKRGKTSEDFFEKVYRVVEKIPYGKVTSYGAIAHAVGMKSSARMVGWALNAKAGLMDLPCHRVLNRNGELTGKMHFATPSLMREMLESEGIEFIGERVNLEHHFWEPLDEGL